VTLSQPLVTIVTPSYNQGHFIRATIESVLSQGYPNVEYLIMDGGSTDATAAVAAEYSSRLTFVSEKDRGQTHAINKGFQRANGSIVAWLNSDDVYLPDAIAHGVAGLAAHPEVGAIYGEGFQIDYDGNVRQQFPFTEPFNLWKLTFVLDYVLQQSVFFRRSCVEAVGWADEALHFGMDWDLLIRLAKRYGLAYVPEKFGCIREYEAAKSFAGGQRRFQELAALLSRHTGRRCPPGWWFYGLDTYDKIWAERIRKVVPGSLVGRDAAALDAARVRQGGRHSRDSAGMGAAARGSGVLHPGEWEAGGAEGCPARRLCDGGAAPPGRSVCAPD